MPLTLQPCNADEEIEAQELIRPVEIQALLPANSCWAFVLENNERIGALMWNRGDNLPENIELAITLIDQDYPNQNLYVGVV